MHLSICQGISLASESFSFFSFSNIYHQLFNRKNYYFHKFKLSLSPKNIKLFIPQRAPFSGVFRYNGEEGKRRLWRPAPGRLIAGHIQRHRSPLPWKPPATSKPAAVVGHALYSGNASNRSKKRKREAVFQNESQPRDRALCEPPRRIPSQGSRATKTRRVRSVRAKAE